MSQPLLGRSSRPTPANPLAADFRNFMYMVWQHLGLPEPTPVQYDIALYLQHGPRRAVIEGFRGVGKSWITAAYVCWLLYRDRDHKVMVVSASKQKADEFSTFVLRLIKEIPVLADLVPRGDNRESMIAFDVNGARPDPSPSVKSVGITGQLTGSRADTIIPDDIEVPHNSDTQGKRDRLSELIKEFDAVIKPGGRIVYLGTPQTEQSIYNELPARGYVIRQWPALVPPDPTKYGVRLAPYVVRLVEKGAPSGSSIDPKRFTDQDLKERALSYGSIGFALQFMLDTSLSDADRHPLKLSDLIVYPVDTYRGPTDIVWGAEPGNARNDLPTVGLQGDRLHKPSWVCADFAAFSTTVMFVDPSGRGKDETAYAVLKELNGKLYLAAAGGFQGGYDDKTLTRLIMLAKQHDVKLILCEPNYGGGMFTKLLQAKAANLYQVGIEDADWTNTQKEKRIIDHLEPVITQHKLVICPTVVEHDYNSVAGYDTETQHQYRLLYQLTRITAQKGALARDDRLDALAGAVAYFRESMSKDSEKAALEHKDAILQKELDKFVAGCLSKGRNSDPRVNATLGRRPASRVLAPPRRGH